MLKLVFISTFIIILQNMNLNVHFNSNSIIVVL